MKAIALALSALLILPLLAAAVEPGVLADVGRSVLPSPAQGANSQTSAAPVGAHLSGPQPFITILCKFADRNEEPRPPAFFEGLFGAAHPGLDDYWREVSYGRIGLTGSRVVGWYTLPRPASAYRNAPAATTDLDLLASDCTAAADADVNFPDYAGINLAFNSTLDDWGWGGEKCFRLDGQSRCYGITWLWPSAYAQQRTVAHELGHTFGLRHSAAGRDEVYGNQWDAMSASGGCAADPSYGDLSPHIIAYDKDRLGWLPTDRKFTALPQGITTIELGALADPASKGYLLALLPIANSKGNFYTVEARLRVGYDIALPADAVLIHKIDPTREPPAMLINHLGDGDTRMSAGMWLPGDVFVDAAGAVAVSVDGATATGFVVTIAAGALPWPIKPSGKGALAPGDIRFAWQRVTGAAGYEVQVEPWAPQSATGGVSRSVSATETTIPMPPGAYHWQVRALPAGEWTPPVRVVVGFAGRRWLPSEVIPAPVGKIRSGLAIAALPQLGLSVAWADTDGMFLPVTVHVAHRDAVEWEVTDQSIPDYDVQVGPIPTLALGPQGEVCGIWLEYEATLGAVRASAVRGTEAGLWFACWAGTQTQTGDGASPATADAARKSRPKDAIRINQEDLAMPPSRPALLLDRAGVAYAVWNGVENGASGLFSARRPAVGPWEPEQKFVEGTGPWSLWLPAIAADDRGSLHAIWADSRTAETELHAATRATDGRWGPDVQVGEAGSGPRINPTIAVDGQGNIYAAWQSVHGCGDDELTGDVGFARRLAGEGWEPSTLVTTDIGGSNVSHPAVAASREGATYLVWEEKIEGRFALFASYRPAGGAWEPKRPVPDAAGNRAPTSPALTTDVDGNPYVTWLDTRTEQPFIRFAQAVK